MEVQPPQTLEVEEQGKHINLHQLLLEEQRQSHKIPQQILEEEQGRGEEQYRMQQETLEEDKEQLKLLEERTQSHQMQQQRQQEKKKDENKNHVRIKVLLFARARELAGISETTLELEGPSSGASITASDCVQNLITLFPALQEIRACMVVALNQTYVSGSAVVKDGDELALIPPISGG